LGYNAASIIGETDREVFMPELLLIPAPRQVAMHGGTWTMPGNVYVLLEPHPATRDLFAAERFEIEAEPLTKSQFHICITAASVSPADEIRVIFDQGVAGGKEQGYGLQISAQGIEIRSSSAAGTYYAFQTLMQIVRQTAFAAVGKKAARKGAEPRIKLPCLEIEDWPDFAKRGVYHDTARGKVPTVATLLQLIDDLGHLKYNEFQLYIENNFEFRKHAAMYDDTTPFTAEDLLLLDSACRARHIDFVPSLTSLGHFEKILSRPAFRRLAEAEPEQLKAIGQPGWSDLPWSLCVTDPDAKALLKDMYDEFVPNFSSKQFNICCDEAYDLGKVRSRELADKVGTGQLYIDWINYCNGLSKGYGKSIQMWGDIILHHPELIPQLPEDAVLLEWGYEADHKFDEHCATFKERIKDESKGGHQTFYVAPGTSSWLTLPSRSKVAFGNIHNSCTAGLKHGAAGVLVTDWGDNGHQQFLAASLNAFAYGAAASWNLAVTPTPYTRGQEKSVRKLLEAISLHLYQDPSRAFASLAYDLGLTYERFSWQRFNGALEWFLFREKWDFANYVNRAKAADLPRVIGACEKLLSRLDESPLLHADADLIRAELMLTAQLVIHTCRRTALRQAWLAADPAKRNPEEETLRAKPPKALPKDFARQMKQLREDAAKLEKQFKKLWLARNKESRLQDVVHEFKRLQREYQTFAKA
jgi:hypothetical protein